MVEESDSKGKIQFKLTHIEEDAKVKLYLVANL